MAWPERARAGEPGGDGRGFEGAALLTDTGEDQPVSMLWDSSNASGDSTYEKSSQGWSAFSSATTNVQASHLLVILFRLWQVEADHVDGVAGVGQVCKEADTFAGTDGAESLGDDVGVAEGAGRAGFVSADEVGAEPAAGPAAGGLAVGGR
jgi:hypothetical protein